MPFHAVRLVSTVPCPVGCIRNLHPSGRGRGRSCPNCVIRGLLRGKNVSSFIQPNAHALFQMKLQIFFSPSYTRSLIERRKDAYILLQSFNRVIPQFARYSLSLAIGATIAGLSPDRGTALVTEKHPSPSRSSSWPQGGRGHDSTSYLEMQLGAHFC